MMKPRKITFEQMLGQLKPSEKMPVIFLGHGNPLYAINDNPFAKNWRALGQKLSRPQAVLCISAHWETRGTTLVHVGQQPKTIHDFYGFPQPLFDVQYPAPGAPDIAKRAVELLVDHHGVESQEWGLDHGAWAVLRHVFPDADVPVFQLSIDMSLGLREQFELAKNLKALRHQGVMIIGSGNIVHNLRQIRMDGKESDWAIEFDQRFSTLLEDGNFSDLVSHDYWGSILNVAHPTLEHFAPSIYCAALAEAGDDIAFFNDQIDMGSLSMRSFIYS